jgi:hypothetical protein
MKLPMMALLAVAAASGQISITTSSLPGGTVGKSYSFSFSAAGGSQPYTWFSSTTPPAGLTFLSNGNLSGTPLAAGTFPLTITVVDARQSFASGSFVLSVGSSSSPAKPVITSSSTLTAGAVGQAYSLALAASGGTPPYQWALAQGALPNGLALAATGTISGTPTTSGSFSFQIGVLDSAQQSAVGSFTLTINAAPLTIITVAPLFPGTVGVLYAQPFSAAGGVPPYSWSITSGNPGGLTLNAASGALQGTPQSSGTFPFTIQVADSHGASASGNYSLTISPPALSTTIAGTVASGMVGVAYSQVLPVVATGGTPPITWSVASGSVPGLTLNLTTLTLSGTPTAAGTFSLTLQAADSAGLTASRTLSIVIAPAALSITTALQLPGVTLNGTYSITMAASGGTPPYTWAANGLPGGLSIDPNSGIISGTASAAGTFSPVITVRDSALAVAQNLFTIVVALPTPPTFTLSGLPSTVQPGQQFPLQLSVGAAYAAAITGTAQLTFTPASGLPDLTVVFASGGTSINFNIPAGSTTPVFNSPFLVQTGTVAGTLNISVSLQAGNTDITPSPAPAVSAQLPAGAPVISAVQTSTSGSTITIMVTGYSTTREVTQAVFNFAAASGQSLQAGASALTVDTGTLFTNWFQSLSNTQYGSQFVYSQPFTIQGSAAAVTPVSVTLTNRVGSTTFPIQQ